MKKLLMFLVLLTASIGARADVNIYLDNGIYKIYGLSEGDLAKIKDGTYSGKIWYDGTDYTASAFTSSTLISEFEQVQIGGSNQTFVLNEDDVKALDMFSNMTTLDLSAITFSDNSIAGSIKCGSSIETVVLPVGLTKEQVNAAGVSLTGCNASFGSCLSSGTATETTTSTVTKYYYTPTGSTEKIEFPNYVNVNGENYSGTVNESVEVSLSEPVSSTYYTNTYNKNQKVNVTPKNGETSWTPDPLDVALNLVSSEYKYNGTVIENWAAKTGPDGKKYLDQWYARNTFGLEPLENTYLVSSTETYNITQTGANYGTFVDGVNQDQDSPNQLFYDNGTAYGQIANNGDNPISFPITTTYTYSYTLDGQTYTYESDNGNLTTYSTTHNVTYSNTDSEHPLTREEEEVENTSTYTTVTAYVNTPGSLYKATNLAGVRSAAEKLIISGKINSEDLAISASTDEGYTTGSVGGPDSQLKYIDTKTYTVADADKYDEVVNFAFNNNAKIASVDISDATIAPNNLRILSTLQRSDLQEVIFPKSCTRIPPGCLNGKSYVNNIVLPNNLQTIGFEAFQGTAIKEIDIPETITEIEFSAFNMCTQLEDVRFAYQLDHNLTLGDCVFYRCDAMERMSFPEGLQNIGEYTFGQCNHLHAVRLPNSLRTIGDGAFYLCTEFESLVIPEGVQTIGRSAFENAPIRDIYLMAKSVATLPAIYSCSVTGRNGDMPETLNNGTFSNAALIANNTGGAPYSSSNGTKIDYTDKTNRQMYNIYQSTLTGGNTICLIHYDPALESFINYNPFPQENNVPLSSTYLIGPNGEGTMWPAQTTAGGSIPGGHRPDKDNESDYLRVMEAGDPGLAINQNTTSNPDYEAGVTTSESLSKIGWRQFALRFGDVKSENVAVEKEYKGVWYTMCFPYYMTDEDLTEAFNDGFNICDFSGVSLMNLNEQQTLVLHFNTIASSEVIQIFADEKPVDVLAKPYTPYMIHPALGPTDFKSCTIKGIYANEDAITSTTALCDNSMNVIGKAVKKSMNATIGDQTVSGNFYFIGNVENPAETVASDATKTVFSGDIAHPLKVVNGGETLGTKFIPQYAYFLGTAAGETYPKYWREMLPNGRTEKGVWTRYTSIVISDQYIESAMERASNGSNSVKSLEIDFSDFTPEDVTAVEQIVEEAKANDVPVQYMNIVYDFNGQIVKKGDASLDNLPTGMYIVNGKKYLVK